MSFFDVTLETLDKVWHHPNADRLDLATAKGMDFQFITGRDNYKPGDTVLYFPIDSLLPEPVIEALGLSGKLSGKDRNRVKTIRLRGAISQGLVCKPGTVLGENWQELKVDSLAKHLGVHKYDPPPIVGQGGKLLALPDGIGVYDIEGADRYTDVLAELMDQPVYISEKLEGTNFSAVREPDGEVYYCQRNHRIEEIEGQPNVYCDTARQIDIPWFLEFLSTRTVFLDKRIVLRGELIGPGIQKNIYKLAKHEIRLFDIKLGPQYIDPRFFCGVVTESLRVPALAFNVLLRDWLEGNTVQQASNGKSRLNPDQIREGIVIKPLSEYRTSFGTATQRCMLKQRSPDYLAKEK